jgi:hypothetical protein
MIAYGILFSPTCGRTRVSHRWCGTGIRVVLTRPKIHAAVRVLNRSGRHKVILRGRIGCLHTNVGCKLEPIPLRKEELYVKRSLTEVLNDRDPHRCSITGVWIAQALMHSSIV